MRVRRKRLSAIGIPMDGLFDESTQPVPRTRAFADPFPLGGKQKEMQRKRRGWQRGHAENSWFCFVKYDIIGV